MCSNTHLDTKVNTQLFSAKYSTEHCKLMDTILRSVVDNSSRN